MTSKQTILDVAGMTCPCCIRNVGDALKAVQGVSAVDVRRREGKVRVEHDPQTATLAALVHALHRAGYESKAVA